MRGGLGAALLFFLLTWALCFGAGAVRGFAPAVDGLDFACLADSITRFHAYTWGETPPPIAQLPKKRVPLEPCAEYEPLHPGFLAAADALGGRWAYLVLASALVAGGMLLWWRAAQGWCAPGSLLPWALWLLLLYPNLIYHQARTYYREPLFTFLTALMAFLLSRAWASRRRGDCLAAGVAWGLAILTKSVWLALVPVLAWAWWRGVPEGRRLRLACFGWMMGACVAVVAPWTVRNLLVLKSPVLVSSLGGWASW